MEQLLTAPQEPFAHECRIRNLYADRLAEFRPHEKLLRTEHSYADTRVRADMRTLDHNDVIRVWEFKIVASYEGLGQVLTYLALARKDVNFTRAIRGVLAAFEIQPEIEVANEVLNLGIELVIVPDKLRLAGGVPPLRAPQAVPQIPQLSTLLFPTPKD